MNLLMKILRLAVALDDKRKKRRAAEYLRSLHLGPMQLTENEKAELAAANRPHEHFGFRELKDFDLVDWQMDQVLECVECRCRRRDAYRELIRPLARALPPAFLAAFERAIAEGERRDPLQREEKAWRDAEKGAPQ